MKVPFRIVISSSALALLGGCGSPILTSGGPRLPEPKCHAAGAQAELGKLVDDETADNARAEAGAMRARIVRFGGIPTMVDIDPQRLNIEVDETGRIRRLRCG
jgi:hypothetical protein